MTLSSVSEWIASSGCLKVASTEVGLDTYARTATTRHYLRPGWVTDAPMARVEMTIVRSLFKAGMVVRHV